MSGNEKLRGPVEPIAVLGYGCRFPGGADDPQAFWRLLRSGGDAITEVPPDRWNADAFYSREPGRPGTAVTRWGGFVRQPVTDFDARFFGMSPREAAHLDPMQRWLLEVTWEALEDAGMPLPTLAGSATGVFVGVFTEDTKLFQLGDGNRNLIGPHTGTGTAMTMAANRLSYWFDLRGPSVSLDTACSSSLIAVHLACQSLWCGESELALAGGTNAMFRPEFTIAESKAGMLSPDGRCKTFDAAANGYVRGEGAGMVVLKPLSAARRDGDRVRALILGTASNQDGRTQGITVPSGTAQQALMHEAFRRAGVSPGRVRYMEAHGTGTPVGDPIEAGALAAVLGIDRPAGDRCVVGSVKTNIGHLEAAAGIAGLIKAVLCLERREIPPHLHFEQPNPAIDFDALRLRVPREVEAWPAEPGPALAAVNSFGFGGANAHAVLAEAPAEAEAAAETPESAVLGDPDRCELVTLSARAPEALAALAAAWVEGLGGAGDGAAAVLDGSLADIAWTSGVRRSHHDHRLTVVARDHGELRNSLQAFLRQEESAGLRHGVAPPGARRRLAWVFSGMGPQWWAMGRELLAEEPVFRAAVERCDTLLHRYTGESLLAEMAAAEERSRMAETRISQPANFALQVGLASLLRSWGVEPDAIVGHSTGEAAAFWAAGVVDLEEAVRIIHYRSTLQHRTTGQGRLAAVELPLEEARAAIAGIADLSIAAVNSPSSVTLSGDAAALEAALAPLQARGVFCRFLRVDVPFHSHFMNPLRDELVTGLANLALAPARVPLYSTVTGERAQGPELDGGYWWRNVREPVYFAAAVDRLLGDGYDTFLEIGPHPVLTAAINECVQRRGAEAVVLSTLRRKSPERAAALDAAGALHTLGRDLDFPALHPRRRRLVDLPLYPWQRGRHWDESAESVRDRLEAPVHPLLGKRRVAARPEWQAVVDRSAPAYLEDHRIQGAVLYPGAAFVELAVAAVRDAVGAERTLELDEIRFDRALFLAQGEPRVIQTCFDPDGLGFEVYSRAIAGDAWTRHARGRLLRARRAAAASPPAADLEALRARLDREVPRAQCYAEMATRGFQYGARFQGLEQVWAAPGEALARIAVPAGAGSTAGYHVHPTYLDAAFQSLLVAILGGDGGSTTYLPVALGQLTVHGRCGSSGWVHSRLVRRAGRVLEGDAQVFDDAGRLQMEIRGARIESLEDKAAEEPLERMFLEQVWSPLAEPGEPAVPDAPTSPSAAPGTGPGTWLLFADRGGVGRGLAERLTAAGASCLAVEPGPEYRCPEVTRAGSLDPARPEHLRRLLADLAAGEQPPCRGIVHLWSLDAPGPENLDEETLLAAQAAGPVALLHMLQALDGAGWREKPRLWVVTRGAQSTGEGDGAVALAQVPVWGFARTVFHQENVELAGGIVDLDPAAAAPGVPGEADLLFDCLWRPTGEDQLALRGGAVLVPRLVPAPQVAAGGVRPRFRSEGAYLVTGGLGGLGLLFARWLVERGARRLVLTGRSPLPPREEWDAVAPGTSAAERIAAVRELESLGARVRVAAFDAADGAGLDALLADLRREGWGPVRGVLHAAGISQPRLVLQTDADVLLATLRPKLAGGWLLHDRLAGEPLDFFVLFSSIAALGFSMGMTDYAAGNAFLDGLAAHRRTRGLPAASVQWGAWGQVGMASVEAVREGFLQRGFLLIPPEQGLEAMERVLEHEPVQPVVLGADWPRIAERNYPVGAPRLLDRLVERAGGPAAAPVTEAPVRERLAAAGEEEREEILAGHLRQMAAAVLRFDPSSLDPARSLSSFGLDSMLAVELRNRAESVLGAGPSVVELLQGASVDDLAVLLLPRLALESAAAPAEVAAETSAAMPADVFPLTHGQRALWFLHQREPESAAYNVAFAGRLVGAVDPEAWRRACQWLVDRHPALRTRYLFEDGRPVQRVEARREVAFSVVDAAGLDDEALRLRVEREYRVPFDLAAGPLLRVHLLRRGPHEHVLLLAAHHIAVDGWSLFLLLEELRALYAPARDGAEPGLAPPAADYAEHVRRQEALLAGAEGERQWAYWSRQLEPLPPPLELPTDRPRPRLQTQNGGAHTFVVDRPLTEGLRQLAKAEETTLFVVLVAVLEALLHRLGGQDRFAVGGTVAGRPSARFAGVVGHFVNSLVLRADLSAGPSFRDLLRQARRTVLEAFDHQDYPFPLLVERLQPQWDPSRSPLFQVSLVLQNLPGLDKLAELLADAPGGEAAVDFGDFTMAPFPLDQQAGQHELELEVYERAESLLVVLQYNSDLFDAATAEQLARRFVTLATDALARPEAAVAELELVSEAERREQEEARARRQAGDRQRLRVSRRQGVRLGATTEEARVADGQEPHARSQSRRVDG
ncbi:MAG TPA: condensation domain-containing protein [Thermoanaerobaculia bacterium]|nr:condensation domain-containing protein [Thermoanaerobaculia bacterium]